MRGITPVITTVLLLLMAVAAVGGAWVWYQRMQTSAMAGGSGQVDQMKKGAAIISVDKLICTSNWYVLTLANTGTIASTLTNVTVGATAGGTAVGYTEAWTVSADSFESMNLTSTANNCATGTMYFVDIRVGGQYLQQNMPVTAK